MNTIKLIFSLSILIDSDAVDYRGFEILAQPDTLKSVHEHLHSHVKSTFEMQGNALQAD